MVSPGISEVKMVQKPRVLLFIGSLASGGKERRLVELLSYFSNEKPYDFLLVMTKKDIHYKKFLELGIPYEVLKGGSNKLKFVSEFFSICKSFKPDVVHTWGRMQTLYALPAIVFNKITLLNSQIASAPPSMQVHTPGYWIDRLNFYYSNRILSNSKAGIEAYKPPFQKSAVIYNGINPSRFTTLPAVVPVREKYGISTPHVVLMAASFTRNKDYTRFIDVAKLVTAQRDDVTFIGVGGTGKSDIIFRQALAQTKDNDRILFPGKINDVEALIQASTIGVLFSNDKVHGEGISNAIIEYMSLAKPVIANDAGGTKEVVLDNFNGYLVKQHTARQIAVLINDLLNNPAKCKQFGDRGKQMIERDFLLDKMGQSFDNVYRSLIKG